MDGTAVISSTFVQTCPNASQQRSPAQVSRVVALEGIGAAPGVVRGAHERLWWTFDADAVRCAVAAAEVGGREEEDVGSVPSRSDGGKEVAELQGFLTRWGVSFFVRSEPAFAGPVYFSFAPLLDVVPCCVCCPQKIYFSFSDCVSCRTSA